MTELGSPTARFSGRVSAATADSGAGAAWLNTKMGNQHLELRVKERKRSRSAFFLGVWFDEKGPRMVSSEERLLC
jgi:hypothetical protein